MPRRNNRGVKSLYWMFTLHATPEGELDYDEPYEWREHVVYCIWQAEVGEETGREHLQGYFVLKNRWFLDQVKANMHDTMHLEARRGTHSQAKDYCRKADTRVLGPFRFGGRLARP